MATLDSAGISGRTFAIAAVLVAVAVGAIVWFAVPGPDARHRFVSPSGTKALELGEMRREGGCLRVAVSEKTAPDGSRTRLGCSLALAETRPVLLNAHPLWSADESSVDVVYADADGVGGRFTLHFATDCTMTGE